MAPSSGENSRLCRNLQSRCTQVRSGRYAFLVMLAKRLSSRVCSPQRTARIGSQDFRAAPRSGVMVGDVVTLCIVGISFWSAICRFHAVHHVSLSQVIRYHFHALRLKQVLLPCLLHFSCHL